MITLNSDIAPIYWQPPDASTLVIRSFLDFFGCCHSGRSNLLLILLTLVVDDVVEAELVDTLGGGDDTEPVTELLLLEVLLGAVERCRLVHVALVVLFRDERNIQVLQVAAGEGDVSNNLDLAVTSLGDDDLVTEVADTALDLDAVVEELLESREVEDLVAHGLRSVDDIL